MSEEVIKFFVGEYVPELGYPFVLINSQWRRKDKGYGAESFIIIQHVPDLHAFTLIKSHIAADLSQSLLHD